MTVTATPTATATATVTATVTASHQPTSPRPAGPTTTVTAPASPTQTHAGDSGRSWIALVVAIGILAAALGALAVYLASRGRAHRRMDAAEWDATLGPLLRTGRWLTDRLAVELADPELASAQGAGKWAEARPTVTDLERSLLGAAHAAPDPMRETRARESAQAVAALRAALDSSVRAGDTPRADAARLDSARLAAECRRRMDELVVNQPPLTPGAGPS